MANVSRRGGCDPSFVHEIHHLLTAIAEGGEANRSRERVASGNAALAVGTVGFIDSLKVGSGHFSRSCLRKSSLGRRRSHPSRADPRCLAPE